MDALTVLLDSYSLEGMLLFFGAITLVIHTMGKAWEWIWDKLRHKYSIQTEEDKLREIIKRLDTIDSKLESTDISLQQIQNTQLQDARSYIFDRHHHFVHTQKCIDDMSLQLLELRFNFYKSSGGNSYVENLMLELRALPRVAAENIKEIQCKGVQ